MEEEVERRVLNTQILQRIAELARYAAENRAAIADVRAGIARLDGDLRVHLAQVEVEREQTGPYLSKLNDLWDWRSRVDGSLALMKWLIAILSGGVALDITFHFVK